MFFGHIGNKSCVVVIENFDSTVTSGSYYIVGDFFGNFDSDVLTVFAPITNLRDYWYPVPVVRRD